MLGCLARHPREPLRRRADHGTSCGLGF